MTVRMVVAAADSAPAEPVLGNIFIREYRVRGSKKLPQREIEKAVYPFLGPRRGEQDVEQARQALEKAYKDLGYQTVVVEVPQQDAKGGVIFMQVVEAPVRRLRVKGAKWYLPSEIKKHAPSMQEGVVPNFNDVKKDIVALNQWRDRKVTPELKVVEPGTVDIDLIVADKSPAHGSIELNNRYNANTTQYRINASLSYGNLWQLGHTLGLSYQVAPERTKDASIYSGYYMMPVPGREGLSFMLNGTKQDSNVSTLGGGAVAGRGEILGFRFMKQLPYESGYFQSLSFGMDYKRFGQDIITAGVTTSAPVTYYPFTLAYSAGKVREKSFTDFNLGATFHLRGMGTRQQFANRRYLADDGFFYVRGDVSHTQDLPGGFQAFAKIQGQASGSSLINTEQIAIGGMSTVRGYLEATQLGDSGIIGSAELRSPTLIGTSDKNSPDEWRFYAFLEGGRVMINNPLPAQTSRYDLASTGVGTRVRVKQHMHGSVDLAMPLITQPHAISNDLYMRFRLWFDF
ncbi:ShlB/FhaC/HecB family hemolysin secretion/activation protein [Prosthecobacter sp.]|uniref:ShlB/FhaC/HecB family hemolysin secretion/activation protein n=1 Tax=Prosthecobacter sp. TaxID=1965333 RepID=UPI0037838506